MAKALRTRQKLMFRTDGLRPRNPRVDAARKRLVGPHQPSRGAERQLARRRSKKSLPEG